VAAQAYDTALPEITDWFTRFNNMRTFEAVALVPQLTEQLVEIVDSVATVKKEKQEEKEREEAEAARIAAEQTAEAERLKAEAATDTTATDQPPVVCIAYQ